MGRKRKKEKRGEKKRTTILKFELEATRLTVDEAIRASPLMN